MLISEKQSAFVEGRLLTDTALIASEINHHIRRRTQGNNGIVGLKIDVSKAYDKLEWCFLENMMVRFRFNKLWRDRVMQCVKTVSYNFMHDRDEFGDIIPQRRIRQGDPISPVFVYPMCRIVEFDHKTG